MASTNRTVGLYAALLMVAYRVAMYGVWGVSFQYLCKERFHLSPAALSLAGSVADVPLFVGFAFGFLRDRVRPRGWGDRAYFAGAAVAIAVLTFAMGAGTPSLSKFVALLLPFGIAVAILMAAAQGLLAALSKVHGMPGRLAVVALVANRGALIFSSGVGGQIDERYGFHAAFFASAALALPLLAFAFWRPRAAFPSGDEPFEMVVPERTGDALRRLLRHRAVYLPAAIIFLWDFAPGWGTPLFYYLTNGVHLSEAQYGTTQSLVSLGNVIAALAYAFLCRQFRLRPLLIVGTILGVLGAPAFLLIHGVAMANAISLVAGLSCGVAVGAYYDLLTRCCPKELEGVASMLFASALTIAADTSDLFGSWLYEKGGFGLALGVSTACTALILPVLFLIPRSITAPPEGETLVDVDPPMVPAAAGSV